MTRHLSTTVRAASLALALALCAASSRADAQSATAVPVAAADTGMKDLPLTPAELKSYAGTYSGTSPEGRTMTLAIVEEKGTLVGTMNGDDSSRLLSQGNAVIRRSSPTCASRSPCRAIVRRSSPCVRAIA